MSHKESFVGKIKIKIRPEQEYITLQALLQIQDFIPTGGMAKIFLQENEVMVNGEKEDRRGRKLYPGDEIEVLGDTFIIVKP